MPQVSFLPLLYRFHTETFLISNHSWQLQHAKVPAADRRQLEHSIKSLRHLGYWAYDDEITINTQSGSQWDGFSMVFCFSWISR